MADVVNQHTASGTGQEFLPEERLRLAESASGVGTFGLGLDSGEWKMSPQVATLLGLEPGAPTSSFADLERVIFADDMLKLRAAIDAATTTGTFYVEFRVRHADGNLRWLAGKGQTNPARCLRGAFYDISERKALEARLLALNETLAARVTEEREEARALEILNRTGNAVAAELDLERLVQTVTDAGVELSGAQFGAFFYNVTNAGGEAYTLYTISGVPREAFSKFPMPRNTAIFEPTFRGTGSVRSPDILSDPRYGRNPPYHGMPKGHLPVRSYLAVPVISRSGEVLGGLFFGHPQPSIFTQRAERLVTGLAAQAAIGIDNARLHQTSQREIDARKQAEEALQRLNETLEERALERARQLAASGVKLEESERQFQSLVEGVTDYAIFMLDPEGIVVNWNRGARRIKGYTREEIVGQHFSRFYTEEDRKNGIPERALATAAQSGRYEVEGWRVRKDGSTFFAGVALSPIHDPSGTLVGFTKITHDLTERVAAEERLRQAQKMEAIGQLTGGVAHDFNNLLTVIIGNLESLKRYTGDPGTDPAKSQRAIENAMRGARRAESVTQRLLAFSRQQPLEPKAVDISRLVAGMSDLLRRTLGEQVAIETVLAGGLWRAHVDPNQLEVAALNLAVNARDAMPPEGGRLTIETANVHLDEAYSGGQADAVLPGQYVMLAISDNGTGMTPAVLAKAFDPFFTTKDVGHGTGLGLSQVYGFVKQSGGHVKIYSELGVGTTVKIYLPRLHSEEAAMAPEAPASVPRGTRNETILVVEDDEDVRRYTTETLRDLGYRVLEAADGPSALRILEGGAEVQLLFTDVGLPGGMNGRQVADAATRIRSSLKVLFTTAHARNAIVHGGRLDPGVELIAKPFTQAALATRLRDILDTVAAAARILVVEDEVLIQMLATDYLEEAGFVAEIAGSAAEAMNKLRFIPGGVDAVIVDVGLPDRAGDVLVQEIRAIHSALPLVLATGHRKSDFAALFKDGRNIAFLSKPYTANSLIAALREAGVVRA